MGPRDKNIKTIFGHKGSLRTQFSSNEGGWSVDRVAARQRTTRTQHSGNLVRKAICTTTMADNPGCVAGPKDWIRSEAVRSQGRSEDILGLAESLSQTRRRRRLSTELCRERGEGSRATRMHGRAWTEDRLAQKTTKRTNRRQRPMHEETRAANGISTAKRPSQKGAQSKGREHKESHREQNQKKVEGSAGSHRRGRS